MRQGYNLINIFLDEGWYYFLYTYKSYPIVMGLSCDACAIPNFES